MIKIDENSHNQQLVSEEFNNVDFKNVQIKEAFGICNVRCHYFNDYKRDLKDVIKGFKSLRILPDQIHIKLQPDGDIYCNAYWYARGYQPVASKEQLFEIYVDFAKYLDSIQELELVIDTDALYDDSTYKEDCTIINDSSYVSFSEAYFGAETEDQVEIVLMP